MKTKTIKPITERVKSFASACKVLGIKPNLPDVTGLPQKHAKAIVAHYKLVIIAEALNEGWKPDYNNDSQYKYYPWFQMELFSYDAWCDIYYTSTVGARLTYKSAELAEYAGTKFQSLYKDYFCM